MGSRRSMTLFEVARDLSSRLVSILQKFQDDPHWRDYLLFYEYFQGDDGAGIGASHQTGWTGLVARLVDLLDELRPEYVLNAATADAFQIGGAAQSGGTFGREPADSGAMALTRCGFPWRSAAGRER